jgi:hypothetical protein
VVNRSSTEGHKLDLPKRKRKRLTRRNVASMGGREERTLRLVQLALFIAPSYGVG